MGVALQNTASTRGTIVRVQCDKCIYKQGWVIAKQQARPCLMRVFLSAATRDIGACRCGSGSTANCAALCRDHGGIAPTDILSTRYDSRFSPAMNYKHLHYFWMIEKCAGVGKAAERLHVTPQSISTQMRQLEAVVGEPL